ncbi:MAG TPA: DNA mismatch repair endonuclease MutL, partial [Candidatus Wallbacteria bacterium]|nr:DNA mismatch repair endonuclease MutL [Candidatus Wallbacteria bacterium]
MTENNIERSQIRILDEGTICRIAAGEVVVSGAYAIKEMIENSIDAGADEIIVDFSGAGLSGITVSDNGRGMTRDDILMALEHHATSKLKTVSDLSEINTYGFRGEALPSIAAVSRCEIISSIDSSLPAISVKIEGGEIKSIQNAAATRGTKIVIKNLFYNTPVRKKFLKSENYENALIIEFVTRYALAHPEIKFSLYSSGREVFTTRRGAGVSEVIASIFPGAISESLIKIEKTVELGEYGPLKAEIYMTPPHVSKPAARFQHYFVNGRPFKNKSVSHAVYEAYQRYMAPKQYPVVFMFLAFAQRHVDVNIHPTKTEVAFACEFKIHDAIRQMVTDGLATSGAVPGDIRTSAKTDPYENRYAYPGPADGGFRQADITAGDAPEEKTDNLFGGAYDRQGTGTDRSRDIQNSNFQITSYSKIRGIECETDDGAGGLNAASQENSQQARGPVGGANDPLASESSGLNIRKIIGQSFDAFIIAEEDDGILIIDQHVAAEKVFYEKILAALKQGSFHSQSLLMPHIYDLS